MNSMKRTPTPFATEGRDVDHLVVVDAPHDDAVDLDRVQPGVERGVDAGEHAVELVAPRQREERLSPKRVERHVHAAKSGGHQIVGELGKADAVGRHRQVDAERAEELEQARDVRPDGGLAPRHPDAVESPPLDADPGHPGLLLVGQELRPVQPLHPLGGHAVGAAEVAAVRDRDPQVLDLTSKRIDQRNRHNPEARRVVDNVFPTPDPLPPVVRSG